MESSRVIKKTNLGSIKTKGRTISSQSVGRMRYLMTNSIFLCLSYLCFLNILDQLIHNKIPFSIYRKTPWNKSATVTTPKFLWETGMKSLSQFLNQPEMTHVRWPEIKRLTLGSLIIMENLGLLIQFQDCSPGIPTTWLRRLNLLATSNQQKQSISKTTTFQQSRTSIKHLRHNFSQKLTL